MNVKQRDRLLGILRQAGLLAVSLQQHQSAIQKEQGNMPWTKIEEEDKEIIDRTKVIINALENLLWQIDESSPT